MQRLDAAKKISNSIRQRLDSEKNQQMDLEQVNKSAEQSFDEAEKMTSAVEKDIELKKKELFKETQDLFEK